jgi:hypothetical protein
METLSETSNWYIVLAYTHTGARIGFKSFRGVGAEDEARAYFESLKERSDAHQIWVDWLSDRRWQQVAGIQRLPDGGWENIGKNILPC